MFERGLEFITGVVSVVGAVSERGPTRPLSSGSVPALLVVGVFGVGRKLLVSRSRVWSGVGICQGGRIRRECRIREGAHAPLVVGSVGTRLDCAARLASLLALVERGAMAVRQVPGNHATKVTRYTSRALSTSCQGKNTGSSEKS